MQNKDYFAFIELDDYACYVIADGIDEDKELESAKIAVTSFIKDFTEKPTMNKFTIRKYLNNASNELIASSRNVRLKASMTVVVTNYSKLIYSVVGNTRFYLFKDGYLKLKSKDESVTQELADKNMLPLDKISKHIERNNLTSYLGESSLSKPYVSKKFKLGDGDVFALLTKGVWENCDAKEIEDALEGAKEPKDVVDSIEDMILSKQSKELENYTLGLTFVEKAYINPERKKLIKKVIIATIVVLLIIAIIVAYLIIKNNEKKDNIAAMGEAKQNAEQYIKNENIEKATEEYKKALDIAKKYKLKDDTEALDEDYKYTEIIVAGDKDLEGKKYDDALDQYILALEKSGDAENIGSGYILKKIDIVKNCINVSDLLTLADKQVEDGMPAEAEANYLEAKRLSLNYYLKDEKKEAMDKLQKIYDQKAADGKDKKAVEDKASADKKESDADQKKTTEEAAKKAEEEKKAAEEKLNKAIDLRKNGDLNYTKGDYVSAKMYYALAKEAFEEINSHSLADELVEKIALMDTKITEVADKKGEADKYVEEANKRYISGDTNSAKVLYLLAKDIYSNLGYTDDVSKVDEKLKAIEQSTSKQSTSEAIASTKNN
ncbi:hypothetical protein psyc5s11_12420 [Clostridium gelidum]|uniref:Serine/threonine protein phosphatase n=1 Tax=Clostridium gelidum TaxID=704125 RepID=A0ABM7T8D6_9CLOT|nr:hypothetical protein psyc5s11_12420 [Clostridium gelidum]